MAQDLHDMTYAIVREEKGGSSISCVQLKRNFGCLFSSRDADQLSR